ncbi:hypothetical protein BpHYR1_046626 [Brachionus plicatilis]|uniref:Uncharacterized protein n=1 Tax=Brachionus plicatilis TaxID=10195 RepID=A0A3M7Q6H0_BRAPC|nr:hypothetical protein BpHYR1_046626 [Brachionus plicatilis]
MGSEASKQNQKNVKIPNSKDQNLEKNNSNFDSTRIKKSKLKKKSSSVKQVKLRTIKEKSTHKYEKNKNLKSRKFSKKNQNLSFYKENSQNLDQISKSPETQTVEETICLSEYNIIPKNLNENVLCEASEQNSFSSGQEEPKIIENLNCEEISTKIVEQISVKPVVTVDTKLKSRLFSDDTTHVEVSPRTAMCLAASLENDLSKGNRGAKMFQVLKQKSQEWIIDETNVKKSPHLQNAPEHQLTNKLNSEFNHFSKLEELKKNQNYKIIVENLTYEMNKIGNKNRQQMVKNNMK